ncbi:hypothetical protein ET524_07870 [Senegalimassilia faecalis]|uniref:Uncharacterized protein n=1 Tax=Senegalimassilia faecalis TaxID=2509433 RepID=A0A4Q2K3T0_9ACTN|nr:hypothetical protein ET524_07870 [Senegalimassilia faecalis]
MALSVTPEASAACGEACATEAPAEADSPLSLLSAGCCACSVSCCCEPDCWLEAASPLWAACLLAAPLAASLAAALPGCCASESACSACAPAAAWASAKAAEGVMETASVTAKNTESAR